jgi:hypothetical protein
MLSFPKTSFYMSPFPSTNVSFNEATISKGRFVSFLPSTPYVILWFKIKNTQKISIMYWASLQKSSNEKILNSMDRYAHKLYHHVLNNFMGTYVILPLSSVAVLSQCNMWNSCILTDSSDFCEWRSKMKPINFWLNKYFFEKVASLFFWFKFN